MTLDKMKAYDIARTELRDLLAVHDSALSVGHKVVCKFRVNHVCGSCGSINNFDHTRRRPFDTIIWAANSVEEYVVYNHFSLDTCFVQNKSLSVSWVS